jgi:hypothetical protein
MSAKPFDKSLIVKERHNAAFKTASRHRPFATSNSQRRLKRLTTAAFQKRRDPAVVARFAGVPAGPGCCFAIYPMPRLSVGSVCIVGGVRCFSPKSPFSSESLSGRSRSWQRLGPYRANYNWRRVARCVLVAASIASDAAAPGPYRLGATDCYWHSSPIYSELPPKYSFSIPLTQYNHAPGDMLSRDLR